MKTLLHDSVGKCWLSDSLKRVDLSFNFITKSLSRQQIYCIDVCNNQSKTLECWTTGHPGCYHNIVCASRGSLWPRSLTTSFEVPELTVSVLSLNCLSLQSIMKLIELSSWYWYEGIILSLDFTCCLFYPATISITFDFPNRLTHVIKVKQTSNSSPWLNGIVLFNLQKSLWCQTWLLPNNDESTSDSSLWPNYRILGDSNCRYLFTFVSIISYNYNIISLLDVYLLLIGVNYLNFPVQPLFL